jgi:TRAP-type C4-dicarboxylate transport system permease small subunit
MTSIERLDRLIARVEKFMIAALLGLMVLTAFAQIVLRNFLGTGLSGSEPLVRYLVLWVGFIGAALAVRQERHITIEVFSLLKPGKSSRLLSALPLLASTLVCAGMTYAAVKFVRDEAQMGNSVFLGLPAWVPELIIPIAFGVMTLRFLLRLASSARGPAAAPAEPPS